jgi:hypothetical protein
MCPACTSSCRQRALALREKDGLGDEQIAARLSVSVGRAQRFIAEAEQLRDLRQYKRDSIPVAPIRELFERRVEEDPALTQVRVAKRAKTDRIQLRRALGLSPTASRTVGGKHRPGSIRTEITVEMASRIVQALDIAPHEIPWL